MGGDPERPHMTRGIGLDAGDVETDTDLGRSSSCRGYLGMGTSSGAALFSCSPFLLLPGACICDNLVYDLPGASNHGACANSFAADFLVPASVKTMARTSLVPVL